MSILLLRLAGPVQSWAGYRLLANQTPVPTAPVPRKSAVAGLLGACLGSRDLETLVKSFELHVRVDRTNAPATDLQVLVPLTDAVQRAATRAEKARTANARVSVPEARHGSTAKGGAGLYNRDFIPHAEFICALTGDDAGRWLDAVKEPQFMSFLGRRANPPAYPFVLGVTELEPISAFHELPRVPRHDERPTDAEDDAQRVRLYEVTGDYHNHHHRLVESLTPATCTREEQMKWVSSHLAR